MGEDTRRRAARLAALDDETLARVLDTRVIPASIGWQDFFDAADALATDDSTRRALAALPAPTLRALQSAGSRPVDDPAERTRLDAAFLLAEDGTPHPEVTRLVATIPLEDLDEDEHSAPPPSDESMAAATAEHTLESIEAMAEIVRIALGSPLTLVTTGALAATERKRLAEAVARPEDLDALISLARTHQLLLTDHRQLLATTRAESWLRSATAPRWIAVADSFVDALPTAIRTESGWRPPTSWPMTFPADPAWPSAAADLLAQAEAWGLIAEDGSEPAWARALGRGDADSASAALITPLPQEVDRIFLQNDLTAISPGPLAAELDVRLRRMALRESHAQASSYRFTAETITHALGEGETAAQMLDFLATISLTGVPQPLEYLIRTTAQRHGTIRVQADPATGGSRIRAADAALAQTLAIDQALRPLGLVPTGDGLLLGRASRDTTLWALVDARYPALAVDAEDRVLPLRRTPPASLPEDVSKVGDRYAQLRERLRSADADDADAAWLERELQAAVKERAQIEITVDVPGGEARVLILEASGLGGGRLRGRDLTADVERTLPMSLIRRVRRT